VYVSLVSGVTTTQFTATGLIGGKTYAFLVSARNAVGFSQNTTATSILCAGIPDAPILSNNAALTTDTQIALVWVDGASS
jgi:cellulose 1,4-beta-cellobiosidase